MEVPENLRCLFTVQLEEEDGRYVIELPSREVTKGQVQTNETYRVVLLESDSSPPGEPATDRAQNRNEDSPQSGPEPPVEMGDQRTVDIEDIGEQGDGIARVERGYVIIVPETEVNERVTIEIENVSQNVAFGEVIERHDYYE